MPRVCHGFGPARVLGVALILSVFAVALLAPQGITRGASKFCPPDRPRLRDVSHRVSRNSTPSGGASRSVGEYARQHRPYTKAARRLAIHAEKVKGSPDWQLPLSVQAIATFTHTAADQDTAGSAPYLKPNNNVEFQTASLFMAAPSPIMSAPSFRAHRCARIWAAGGPPVHLGQP